MKLSYKEFGSGFPVVIIHGLYGCSDNWVSFARRLSANFRVIVIDLRNHGYSPHSEDHSYSAMATDVYELFQLLKIASANVIGHSMGGRVAMLFNSLYPNLVERLVIVDISPKVENIATVASRMVLSEHRRILKSLASLQLAELKNRNQADELLARRLPHAPLRRFLLKNLKWSSKTGFSWGFNLDVIRANIEVILRGVEVEPSAKSKVLLIKGENSIYMPDQQIPQMLQVYPMLKVVNVANAGHWVHAEQPEEFYCLVTSFFNL